MASNLDAMHFQLNEEMELILSHLFVTIPVRSEGLEELRHRVFLLPEDKGVNGSQGVSNVDLTHAHESGISPVLLVQHMAIFAVVNDGKPACPTACLHQENSRG